MKKLLILLFSAVLLAGLCVGCQSSGSNPIQSDTEQSESNLSSDSPSDSASDKTSDSNSSDEGENGWSEWA